MDGNFLLGFSSGYMSDVEIVNLAATASSVTPKTFNFTGTSGVETINVGAANAPIIVSNISDTGLTLNLSGQSSGAFDVGFATGTISGSGSSLTVGVTDVGSTGTNVSLTANLITDLDIVSYGSSNHITLDGSVNDIVNISVAGAGDLVIGGIPASASGFTSASAGGDVTLTVDTDSNTAMLASGQTITGGAGFDSLSLQGGGIVAAASTGIEELIFDGSTSQVIVRATGMAGLNTLTFSGQGASVPSISGLSDQALTVNATLESQSTDRQQVISGSGTLTVNLKGNPTQVGLEAVSDNDFDFKASTTAAIDINVGPYVSASGLYVLNDSTGDLGITVDSTSTFGSHVQASGASTISILGGGNINATVSGQNTTAITVNAGSGTLAVGSSAANSFTLNTSGNITIPDTTSRLSGVQTLSVTVGNNTADLSGNTMGFADARTVTLAGAGSASTVKLNHFSGSGSNIVMSMTGLAGGVSIANLDNVSAAITIGGETSTGRLDIANMKLLGPDAVTISTGTAGQYSAGLTEVGGNYTLDMSANTSGSASLAVTTFSSKGAAAISMGSGSGDVSLASIKTQSTFTLDASNFGGTIDLGTITAAGNMTVSMGSEGHFSASTIGSFGSLTVDGANSSTGQLTLQVVTAVGGITVSMGTGSGGIVMTDNDTGGNFILDASNFGGSIDTKDVSASGSVVVSMGSEGDFSASSVVSVGAFTLDGAVSTTGQVVLSDVSSGGNFTVSMGSGTGTLVAGSITTTGNLVIDGTNFGGDMDVTFATASGAVTVSVGSNGDFSAKDIVAGGNVTFDAAASTTGQIVLTGISADGNVTVSMGTGTGQISMGGTVTTGSFTIDASTFGGAVDLSLVTASGAAVVSMGTAGDFSAKEVHSTGSITVDGATSTTADIKIGVLSASGAVTVALGTGSGTFEIEESIVSNKGFVFDGTKSSATLDFTQITSSGAVTLSVGNGNFTAGSTEVSGAYTLDKSTSTTGNAVLKFLSAGGNATINMGTGSGDLTLSSATSGANFVIDASQNSGAMTITAISADNAITISLNGADRDNFAATILNAGDDLTISQANASSGTFTLTDVSASGSINITLGADAAAAGAGNMTVSAATTAKAFTFNGSQNGDLSLQAISASASLTVNVIGEGSLFTSSLQSLGAISITKTLGSAKEMTMQDISAGNTTITLGAASGHISASTISVNNFTLDASLSTEDTTAFSLNTLSAGGATNITLGANNALTASAITINSAGGSLTKGTGSADVTIAVGISSAAAFTLGGGGSGTLSGSTITVVGGFTFNGENVADNGAPYFSANTITNATSGAVAFNFGAGGSGMFRVSAINNVSAFTLTGPNLVTANMSVTQLSATESVTFSMGGAKGSATFSAITTEGSFVYDAANTGNLSLEIGSLSASAATMTLGANATSTHTISMSVVDVKSVFTLNGANYRDLYTADQISASAVSVTFGDLSDGFVASSLNAVNLTFNGGDGTLFSANITSAIITGSDWSILMPEQGNQLTIGSLAFSASGTVTMTNLGDTVSASSTSASGDTLKVEFNLGEDSVADTLSYSNGGGKELVKIYNFDKGQDALKISNKGTSATSTGVVTAASIIGGALGASISSTDVSSAGVTATFVYNGDLFFLANPDFNALDGTFGPGEVVFQFVGISSIESGDVTQI